MGRPARSCCLNSGASAVPLSMVGTRLVWNAVPFGFCMPILKGSVFPGMTEERYAEFWALRWQGWQNFIFWMYSTLAMARPALETLSLTEGRVVAVRNLLKASLITIRIVNWEFGVWVLSLSLIIWCVCFFVFHFFSSAKGKSVLTFFKVVLWSH